MGGGGEAANSLSVDMFLFSMGRESYTIHQQQQTKAFLKKVDTVGTGPAAHSSPGFSPIEVYPSHGVPLYFCRKPPSQYFYLSITSKAKNSTERICVQYNKRKNIKREMSSI